MDRKQAVVSEPNINGGSNDIHSMTKAQTITYIYYPTYPGHDKAKGRSALYQVTYTIYAVYSLIKHGLLYGTSRNPWKQFDDDAF